MPHGDATVRAGGWQDTVGTDLEGATLGLLGLGRLGGRVARVGLAFGMDVVAWSQNLDPATAREQGVEPVSKDALLSALHAGEMAGAGLVVFDEEPLPGGHALRTAPRTVLVPHLGYVTDGGYRLFYGDAVDDVAAWLDGSPLRVVTAG
ncbi:MAG: NAD(P)-dependent oxidoreductase [Nocardioidaceae bacterium]